MSHSQYPQGEKNHLGNANSGGTDHPSSSRDHSNLSPEKEEEKQKLIQEEKAVEKAQRLTLYRKLTQSVSYLVGALEILLGLRFLLLVTGANSENIFASFIYRLSQPFSLPFSNLFAMVKFNEGGNVFDINLLFGMLVYLLLMFLVNWFIKIIAKP